MDNTVGSLTQLQKSLITGSVLGDGYLRRMPNRTNAFMTIHHSYKQREYVDWKFVKLKNICKSKPKINKDRNDYRFYTKQHPFLTNLYNKFYREKEKRIPGELELNKITLAVWYMDDGSKCGKYDFYLNTQQFTVEDQEKLVSKLEKIGISSSLNKDKEYYRIRLKYSSTKRLSALIGKIIIPSMQYKLSYNPVET